MSRRSIYRWLAILNDLSAIASGRPGRIARRAKNRVLGRALGKAGFWRRLWR